MVRFGVGLLSDESVRDAIEQAKLADSSGFFGLWVADTRFFREVYSTITLCALNTKRIKLATAVTDPYTRHPALTAMGIATVDEISGGRAILGIGAGNSGLKQLRIERRHPATAIREAVEIVRELLAGKTVTKKGAVIQVEGAKLDFVPLRADIPVYIGARGPRLIEVAGAIGDGASLGGGRGASKESLEFAIKLLKSSSAKAGRDFNKIDIMSWIATSISDDSDKAIDRLRGFVGLLVQNADFEVLETLGVHRDVAEKVKRDMDDAKFTRREIYAGEPEPMRRLRSIVDDDLVDHLTLAGSPSDCVRKIRELSDAGATSISILPQPAPGMGKVQTIKLFAEEVVPHFAQMDNAP